MNWVYAGAPDDVATSTSLLTSVATRRPPRKCLALAALLPGRRCSAEPPAVPGVGLVSPRTLLPKTRRGQSDRPISSRPTPGHPNPPERHAFGRRTAEPSAERSVVCGRDGGLERRVRMVRWRGAAPTGRELLVLLP